MTGEWQGAMLAELDAMDPLDDYTTCGEWITVMQQELVPMLAERRRGKLIEAAEANGGDYYEIAERVGSRKATIERLVNEGRAQRRGREEHSHAA